MAVRGEKGKRVICHIRVHIERAGHRKTMYTYLSLNQRGKGEEVFSVPSPIDIEKEEKEEDRPMLL